MKKNYKDMTRKYFYVFDMVLFGLLLTRCLMLP